MELRSSIYFPAVVVCQSNTTSIGSVHCNFTTASLDDSGDRGHAHPAHDYSNHPCSNSVSSPVPGRSDVCFVANAERTAFSEASGYLEVYFQLKSTANNISRALVRLVDPLQLQVGPSHLYDAKPSFYSWLEPGSMTYVLLTKSEDQYLDGSSTSRFLAIPSMAPPASSTDTDAGVKIRLVYQDNYVTVRLQEPAYTWSE